MLYMGTSKISLLPASLMHVLGWTHVFPRSLIPGLTGLRQKFEFFEVPIYRSMREIGKVSVSTCGPSNKPLEWTGHRQASASAPCSLPATQWQRSKVQGANLIYSTFRYLFYHFCWEPLSNCTKILALLHRSKNDWQTNNIDASQKPGYL